MMVEDLQQLPPLSNPSNTVQSLMSGATPFHQHSSPVIQQPLAVQCQQPHAVQSQQPPAVQCQQLFIAAEESQQLAMVGAMIILPSSRKTHQV